VKDKTGKQSNIERTVFSFICSGPSPRVCKINGGQHGAHLARQCTAGRTKKDGDFFEECYVQQTDSSVKKCIIGNLTVKQIYR